ncbi:unnamed protein product [Rhizoctonia solani]|uniref:Asl1-like glycosyl hydrolase catalytic domain-containing protein n=1 Tax=Rhizoctonia solani TaxID=456999 RepID=A0A8H3BIC2_9AGAM|nr:unnamed protein product [Rhizoctonia solani]CAE6457654.1 unnamed protein product [Rhizoctonia solani]
MAVMSRLLPLFAYSTFALFLVVLLATPTNALAHEPRAHVARGHDSIAKRKRNPVKRAKRCRPQTSSLVAATTSPTSSLAPATTAQATTTPATTAPATTQAAPSTTPEPVTTKAATSSTHSSSSAAAVTTSVSVSTGGGNTNKKLLLAWPNGPTNLDKFQYGTNVAGMYTWSPWCPDNAKIPCFQQLWGTKQKSSFTSLINVAKSNLVFGFNEPNQGDQSNMSAQDGATLWNQVIKPLKAQGAKLVSPATTSAPSGKTWIQDMEKACGGDCGFDYIALHWYGTSIDSFKAYVDDWYKTFGKPLIISEYACQDFSGGAQCSKDQTNTFHYTMGAWFDQHPGVAMYAPFGFMADMNNVNYDNQLMGSDGGPNALGNWYLYHE